MKSLLVALFVLAVVSQDSTAQSASSKVDREAFYTSCASSFPKYLFKGESRLAFDGIFDYWDATLYEDKRWLAYILATAHRESAGTMRPVREGLCETNQCSIDAVTRYMNKQNRPKEDNYALPDKKGRSYYGRGLVQITHKINYERISKNLGWGDLLASDPDLALDRDKAIKILIEGSVQGMFTRDKKSGQWRNLPMYLNDTETDWLGARGVINPGSKRAYIPAETAKVFYACLSQ
ncbi:glycoside hydrolase family 19 protein [Pseudomonas aeruginosa]